MWLQADTLIYILCSVGTHKWRLSYKHIIYDNLDKRLIVIIEESIETYNNIIECSYPFINAKMKPLKY